TDDDQLRPLGKPTERLDELVEIVPDREVVHHLDTEDLQLTAQPGRVAVGEVAEQELAPDRQDRGTGWPIADPSPHLLERGVPHRWHWRLVHPAPPRQSARPTREP